MKICPKCNIEHFKVGKFCSRKCANSRNWNDADKLKKSISAKNSIKVLNANKNINRLYFKNYVKKIKLCCLFCNKNFLARPCEHNKKFCCKICYYKYPNKKTLFKKPVGGLRHNSGRGKQGWYKGYYCNSSWELAWVIYQLEHGLKFDRNNQGFEYIFDNKKHKFYPDFILSDGTYLEIKGYFTNQTKEKINQFSGKLKVLYKNDIKPYINYVIEKYGKNYIRLYEK